MIYHEIIYHETEWNSEAENEQRQKPVWKSPDIFPAAVLSKLNFHLK